MFELGRSPLEYDASRLRPLVTERSRLMADGTAGQGTILVNSLPRNVEASQGYVVIDPYTTEMEIRRVTSRAGKGLVLSGTLDYAHSRYDEILYTDSPNIYATWAGVKADGTTDNGTALQRAINQGSIYDGNVLLPTGEITYGTPSLTLYEHSGIMGVRRSIAGTAGTWLHYTGSGTAITINGQNTGFDSRRNIVLKDFSLDCGSAVYGIYCDFATHFTFEGLRVTGANTAELYMENCYNGVVRQSRFDSGSIGVHFKVKNDAGDNVMSGQTLFEQCDFWDCGSAGVKIEQPYNTLAQLTFLRCHAQSNGYGAYIDKDHRSLWLGCHFEINTINQVYVGTGALYGPIMIGCFFDHSGTVYAVNDRGNQSLWMANEFYTPGTAYGIFLAGENARAVDNTFRSMSNSLVLGTAAVRPKVGVNYWTSEVGNKVTDNGANSVLWEGEIIIKSPVLDLSAAGVTHFAMCADRDLYLREAKVIYTEASSADAGVVVRAGKTGSAAYLFSYTSATSQAQWTIAVPSLSNAFIAAGEIITFGTEGGKTGTGEVVIELYFLPFNMT